MKRTTSPTTTFLQRFQQALAVMCRKEPPLEFCQMWLANQQDENSCDPLQSWVLEQNIPSWAQGIVTIDAAMLWADEPEEGADHEVRDPRVTEEDIDGPDAALDHVRESAESLVSLAEGLGVDLRIERHSLLPLAMGNAETRVYVSTFFKRA